MMSQYQCPSCVFTFSSDYSAQLVPVTSPATHLAPPTVFTLIISAHSVANFVLSSISVVAGMCYAACLQALLSQPTDLDTKKMHFFHRCIDGGIIKYWKLVQSRIFGEKFGKSGMWANQLSPHLLELSTFVVAVSSVPLNPQLQRGNGKKWWSF